MLSLEIIDEITKVDGGKFKVDSLERAYSFCEKISKSHYENFPIASKLLPANKRKYVYAVYSFARIADDIADETYNIKNRLDALNSFESLLKLENTQNPVFFALKDTISKNNLDINLFYMLLKAFKYDADFKPFDRLEDVFEYCDNSANPIGRLILALFGENNEIAYKLSDKICTALQLTNFWQDFSVDIPKGRYYIPLEYFEKYKFDKANLFDTKNSSNIIECIDSLIIITEGLFKEGKEILNIVKSKRLALELKFIILGGQKVLNLCKQNKLTLLYERPKLNKTDFIILMIKSIL